MISDQNYLNWRKKTEERAGLRFILGLFGIYAIIIVFIIGFYLALQGQFQAIFLIALSFILARLVMNPLIYLIYKSQRPYQKLKFVPLNSPWLFSGITERFNSFPSDHSASMAAITFSLFWVMPLLGFLLLPVTILNGVSRVMLGYHHVSDILAGWLVGASAAWISIHWLLPIILK